MKKIDILNMSLQEKQSLALTVIKRDDPFLVSNPHNNKPVILTHVPRTAGVTMDAILLGVAHYFKRSWVRLPGDAYSQYWGNPKPNILGSVTELKEQLNDAYLISGHMPFGLHQKLALDPIYITVLRDPIERAWSQIRRIARDDGELSDPKILELINNGGVIDNLQVRMISGCLDKNEKCDEKMLEQAKYNLLNYYALVGLVDNFNVFLTSLLSGLGWPDLMFRTRNISEKLKEDPSLIVHRSLTNQNEYDSVLVEYAKNIVLKKSSKFISERDSRGEFKQLQVEDTLFSLDPFTLGDNSIGVLGHDHFCSLEKELLRAGVSLSKVQM